MGISFCWALDPINGNCVKPKISLPCIDDPRPRRTSKYDWAGVVDPFKKYSTQFIVAGNPSEGHSVLELEGKIMEQIERLKTTLVPDEELNRVKAQVLAQKVFGRDSMSDQAIRLGMFESVGLPWQLSDEIVDRVKAITAEDIMRVSKQYFDLKRLTVAELIPEKITASH